MALDAFVYAISAATVSESITKRDISLFSSSPSLQLPNHLCSGLDSHPVFLELVNTSDRKFRLLINRESLCLTEKIFSDELRRTAIADYFLRSFRNAVADSRLSGCHLPIILPSFDQFILYRSCMNISAENGEVAIDFKVSRMSDNLAEEFLLKTLPSVVHQWILHCQTALPAAVTYWQCIEDQQRLRELVSAVGVAFVANGSILPRAGNFLTLLFSCAVIRMSVMCSSLHAIQR